METLTGLNIVDSGIKSPFTTTTNKTSNIKQLSLSSMVLCHQSYEFEYM